MIILDKILRKWRRYKFCHINWMETLFFNLRNFPFSIALQIPVYIYNNTEIVENNTILLDGKVKKGMVRIGGSPAKAYGKTKIINRGTMIFHGEAQIWGGSIIENWGIIEFGDKCAMAENCKVMCQSKIVLGDYVHFGYQCTLMDTDFHFILDLNKNTVRRNTNPIIIESGTWISSDCKIMKGSHIPKNSIVSGGCLINKDFSTEDPCQIYIGVPGKPRKQGYRRIYNVLEERKWQALFNANTTTDILKVKIQENMDEYCFSNCLNFFEKTK